MFRAKESGRDTYRFFSADMQARSLRVLQIENALRSALVLGQLTLHYQPQIRLKDRRLVGVEALLRWTHPELGVVSPAEFIPVAESSGQILGIGEWVLRTALAQARQWRDAGHTELVVAVNLSMVQFRHPGLVDMVGRALADSNVPPQMLELELTESIAMDAPEQVIAIVRQLYDLGVQLSIDDFGTGYSSFSYIQRLKVHKLTIDQSFVRHRGEDPVRPTSCAPSSAWRKAWAWRPSLKVWRRSRSVTCFWDWAATRGRVTTSAAPCPPPTCRGFLPKATRYWVERAEARGRPTPKENRRVVGAAVGVSAKVLARGSPAACAGS